VKATGIVAAFIWQLFVIARQVSVYVNHVYKLEKQKTDRSRSGESGDQGQKKVWHLGYKSIQMRRVCP